MAPPGKSAFVRIGIADDPAAAHHKNTAQMPAAGSSSAWRRKTLFVIRISWLRNLLLIQSGHTR